MSPKIKRCARYAHDRLKCRCPQRRRRGDRIQRRMVPIAFRCAITSKVPVTVDREGCGCEA